MIALAAVESLYSIYVMRKIHDEHMWHRVTSKMLLLVLMIAAIWSMLDSGDTTLMLLWVIYFVFIIHKGNKEYLDHHMNNTKGDDDGIFGYTI